jgi:hypothetical integral membrane protein (TIGR02206 family)
VSASLTPSHLAGLVSFLAAALILVPAARRWSGAWVTWCSWLLAVLLVVNEVAYQLVLIHDGNWTARTSLPLYLCDVGAFVVAAALVTRRQRLVELSWFWAVAGTLQAIVTPDHDISFPSYDWVQFYGDHSGIVLGALLLVIGRRIYPEAGAIRRVILMTLGFTIAVGVGDLLTGGNYMYLRQAPAGTVLSLFGPWPSYLLAATVLAIALIVALDIPFWPERRRRRGAGSGAGGPPGGSGPTSLPAPATSATGGDGGRARA